MENNEQLTQNPAIEGGIENETTTSKAATKAIDGNEKKKIVKLIQPSILPGKVKVEVNTLVAEMIAETAPVADEVMPEMVDAAAPDEAEPCSRGAIRPTRRQRRWRCDGQGSCSRAYNR